MFNVPHNAPPGLQRLIDALENVQSDTNGINARCPCHEDRKNSLGLTVSNAGKVLIKCLAGCKTADIVYACGVTMRELFPDHGGVAGTQKYSSPRGRIVAEYSYHDADGNVLYQVCRMEPKDFRQRRPDGKGGWNWKTKGLEKVLYRLPELIKADKDEFVFIAEGEKDVDALWAIGCVATTNPGGADITGSKWLKKFNGYLKARHVVILPDNDATGKGHAACVADSLKDTAASIRILELPDLPEKGDVSDWIRAGGTREALIQLAAQVRADELPVPPTKLARQQEKESAKNPSDPAATLIEIQITNGVDLDVLGYVDGGKVKVWSRFHRKTEIIDADRLSYPALLRLCGPVAKGKVACGKEPGEGEHTVNQVKAAIALLAGYRKIEDDTEVGIGCWEGLDDNGHPTASVVMVGSREAAVLNGEPNFKRITTPQYGGRTMDLSAESPWFSYDRLCSLMATYSRDWAAATTKELESLFRQWVWADQRMTPTVMTGCVLASFVQTLWKWRPQVAVIGATNTGKSTLFEFLGGGENTLGVFGRLAIKSDQSSSAGLRQYLSRSASIPICDEFDNTKERKEIIEMIRSASRGGTLLRGTAGKQRGVSFVLRHIFWLGGITIDMQRAPDRNRFIIAELLPPPEDRRGKLSLPGSVELQELGEKLLVIAVRNAFKAKEMAARLRVARIEGVNDRIIESYSVPAAMLATIFETDDAKAVELLREMVDDTRGSQQDEKDQEILMSDLLAAKVQVAGSQWMTVAQILNDRSSGDLMDALATNGVGVVYDSHAPRSSAAGHSGKLLFVAHRIAGRLLMRGTTWESQALDQILVRIPGALQGRRRVGGSNQRGVTIPWEYLESFGVRKYEPDSDVEIPDDGGF